MQPIQLLIQTSDIYLADAVMTDLPKHGVNVEELLLKSGDLKALAVTITTTVALNLLSSWLYDYVKDQPTHQTVINGNNISGQTVSISTINQIICSSKDQDKKGNSR